MEAIEVILYTMMLRTTRDSMGVSNQNVVYQCIFSLTVCDVLFDSTFHMVTTDLFLFLNLRAADGTIFWGIVCLAPAEDEKVV